MKQKLILLLLQDDGKFIDQKEVYVDIAQDALITVHQQGFEDEYELRGE